MSQPSRYVLTDADVVLELTDQQVGVLSYVLRRAQEDREFFEQLAGSSPDPGAVRVMRATLSQLVTKTAAARQVKKR